MERLRFMELTSQKVRIISQCSLTPILVSDSFSTNRAYLISWNRPLCLAKCKVLPTTIDNAFHPIHESTSWFSLSHTLITTTIIFLYFPGVISATLSCSFLCVSRHMQAINLSTVLNSWGDWILSSSFRQQIEWLHEVVTFRLTVLGSAKGRYKF